MNNSLVSIIIPTKNSASTLGDVLDSVARQTYKQIEIIVVDNHSSDNTQLIANEHHVNFYIRGPERSMQRNYGARKARGDFFIFLDSDIGLTPTVVEECVHCAEKGTEVITFPEAIIGEGYWAKCRSLEARCYLDDDTMEAPRFYSREAFESLNGFDEGLNGTEDWDLRERALKSGYKIGRTKSLTMHYEGRVNVMNRIRKKIYYAETLKLYIKKNPGVAIRQIPFFRACYLRNWRILLKDPLHTFGFLLLKFSETTAVAFAILFKK